MSKWKLLIPAIALIAALPSVSEAQISVPFATPTYHVQVQKEFWRSGGTYWLTVFSTDNEADAQLMFELLDDALENGTICQYLDCGFDWIIRDVRLTVTWEYQLAERSQYISPYTTKPIYQFSP